jgi:hypothetical protein
MVWISWHGNANKFLPSAAPTARSQMPIPLAMRPRLSGLRKYAQFSLWSSIQVICLNRSSSAPGPPTFQSNLYYHDYPQPIPQTISAVSTYVSRRTDTPLWADFNQALDPPQYYRRRPQLLRSKRDIGVSSPHRTDQAHFMRFVNL